MAVGDKVAIHYVFLDPNGKINSAPNAKLSSKGGVFDVACCPGSAPPSHFTNEPEAVTCELCQESQVFLDHQAEIKAIAGGQSAADRALAAHRLKKQQADMDAEAQATLKAEIDAEAQLMATATE